MYLKLKKLIKKSIKKILPVFLHNILRNNLVKILRARDNAAAKEDFMLAFKDDTELERLRMISTIRIIQPTFYDKKGNIFLSGGAERYLLKLCDIIISLGITPYIIQYGSSNWRIQHNKINIFGIKTIYQSNLNIFAHHPLFGSPVATIYSPFSLAFPEIANNAIGISHGIYWDHTAFDFKVVQDIVTGFRNIAHFVSVDTSTITYFRAFPGVQGAHKHIRYIPNYVDLTTFKPLTKTSGTSETDPKIILFPRRLYNVRGYFLVADIIGDILQRYPYIEFHFVGQCHCSDAIKSRTNLQSLYGSKVQFYEVEADEIYKVYQKAYITLIPTLASEGTSFSCLEAMATGNAVIATNVGGLTDLIIDKYNGLLIAPDKKELFDAISLLLDSPQLVKKLGENARSVAQEFSELLWIERWKDVLKNVSS